MWLVCPNCRAQGELQEGQATPARVRCPACGVNFAPAAAGEIVLAPVLAPTLTPHLPPVVLVRVQPSPPARTCDYCGEAIQTAAKKCRHCGEILDAKLRKAEAKRIARAGAAPPSVVIHNTVSVSASSKSKAGANASAGGCGCLLVLLALLGLLILI